MMNAMLVAGIACLSAGFLAIGFGIPVNEFSFGNTLILAGAMAACAGLIILCMWIAVRELKNFSERMGGGGPGRRSSAAQPAVAAAIDWPAEHDGPKFDDRADDEWAESPETPGHPSAPPTVPWQEEAATRDRPRSEADSSPEPPAAKPRRNLMFSSSARRQRERAQEHAADLSASEPHSAAPPTPPPESEMPPVTFEDAWPKSERSKPAEPQRRSGRAPSTFSEPSASRRPPAAAAVEQPAVTVLKSGVVDGMAYSLYSDGSIEAQMPEGMMRFASIDELRAHLDQRP
jgi:hypothetical protein